MNKAYKIIWSHARNCYVVVSELAKTRGKNNTKSVFSRLAARSKSTVNHMVAALRFFSAAGSQNLPVTVKEYGFTSARCILPLVTFGLLLQAAPAFASVITDKNGASVINAAEKVHNIYAQRQVINDKVSLSINQFQKYNVTAGDVANMHFRMTKDGKDANTLLNLVKERINIGGTVNAIKGNRIDGDL